MALPNLSYVRILGLDYRLVPMAPTIGDLAKCRAFIDEDALEIHVQHNLPNQRLVEVILHECFHAMIDGTAAGDLGTEPGETTEGDEKLVIRLGRAMTLFIRDNQDLVGWMKEQL